MSSVKTIIKNVNKLQGEWLNLIKSLTTDRLMIRGSFGVTHRRCGANNCWCRDGIGHPYRRITWLENGESRTKSITEEDISWIELVTNNYKKFKKTKRKFFDLQIKLKSKLDQLEHALISKTRKTRKDLWPL